MNYDDNDDDDSAFTNWMADTPKPVPPPKLFSTIEEESYGPKPVKVKPPKLDDNGDEIEDDGYRKPWALQGHPPVPEHLASGVMASMKLTRDQHTLFIALGGTTWLKEVLAKVNLERDKCFRLKERDRIAAFRARSAARKLLKNQIKLRVVEKDDD